MDTAVADALTIGTWGSEARLDALKASGILDTPDDPRFDDIARLAATICGAPIALVTFLADGDRHWFKAAVGTDLRESPRSSSFCETIVKTDQPLVVNDARNDERFRDLPVVLGSPFVQFYAGYPVRSPDHQHVLGTVCVLDVSPRALSDAQREGLASLARQVEVLLELHARIERAEAVEKRLSHLELVTRAALDVFLFLDDGGAIIEANPRAEEMYGYTQEELSKMHIRDLRVPGDDAELQKTLADVRSGGARFATQHRDRAGHTLQVEVAAAPIPRREPAPGFESERRPAGAPGRTPAIFTVIRDIGDRVEAARIGATVRAIMQNLQDGVVVTTADSRIIDWNDGAERILGYRADEVLGKDSAMLFAAPESESHRHLLYKLFKTGSYTGEVRTRDRAGAEVPVEVSISVVDARNGAPALCVSILRDIRSRIERERELERAKDAAEAANLVKTRFLGNMTHELRTPLNAILGFARVLQKESYGPLNESQRTYVKDVLDSGEHMLRLVTDLLDLQRAEEGRTTLELRPVSIRRVSDDALRMVRELAVERQHEVTLVTSVMEGSAARERATTENEPQMVADAHRLVQVLVNLLANAIAYTPSGGRIRLRVDVRSNEVTFTVEDNGVGISESDQARLFREFERLGDPNVARGFGIGLALSKRIVVEHGGSIRAESRFGEGSRFIVSIPRRLEQMDKWSRTVSS